MEAHSESQARTEHLIRLIAHDLRNPLTAVQLNGQLIERTAGQAGRDREQRWARSIVDAARRMDDMLGKLVECERIRCGRVALPLAGADLDDLLHEAATQTRATIQVEPSSTATIPISANRVRLVQALSSLLALAAQEPATDESVHVATAISHGNACCRISVVRTPKSADAEPGSGTNGQAPGNTGGQAIALHHARTLIECHRGTLDVHETADEVAFTVELPLASESAAR